MENHFLAMGEHHEKIWSITKENLRRIVPADKFGATETKIDSFAAGYGMGLGVNIQHYNPLIDDEVKAHFDVPESWSLVAQMVFGAPLAPPQPIEKMPIEERVKVFR